MKITLNDPNELDRILFRIFQNTHDVTLTTDQSGSVKKTNHVWLASGKTNCSKLWAFWGQERDLRPWSACVLGMRTAEQIRLQFLKLANQSIQCRIKWIQGQSFKLFMNISTLFSLNVQPAVAPPKSWHPIGPVAYKLYQVGSTMVLHLVPGTDVDVSGQNKNKGRCANKKHRKLWFSPVFMFQHSTKKTIEEFQLGGFMNLEGFYCITCEEVNVRRIYPSHWGWVSQSCDGRKDMVVFFDVQVCFVKCLVAAQTWWRWHGLPMYIFLRFIYSYTCTTMYNHVTMCI